MLLGFQIPNEEPEILHIGGPSTGTMHALDEIFDLIRQRAPVPMVIHD